MNTIKLKYIIFFPSLWFIIYNILLIINYELLIIFGFLITLIIINKNSEIIFNFFKEDIEKELYFFYDFLQKKRIPL